MLLQLGIVSTEGGLVEGENILLENSRYVDVFKGIPFADFPGRFEKPKRHPGWDGGCIYQNFPVIQFASR